MVNDCCGIDRNTAADRSGLGGRLDDHGAVPLMFTPLDILEKQPAEFEVWQPSTRIVPRHQLQYNNRVIRKCDYTVSNSEEHTGPAAELVENAGPECDKV